jgi:hypothetical protein
MLVIRELHSTLRAENFRKMSGVILKKIHRYREPKSWSLEAESSLANFLVHGSRQMKF